MNSTQFLLDKYKNYISRNKNLGLYNKNNSDKFWGNIPSGYSQLIFLSRYVGKDYSFFDIGCGAGQVLDFARNIGIDKVSGLEIDNELYQECINNGFDVINGDLINIDLSFLKNFDILYFYCIIKDESLMGLTMQRICDSMKVGSIIKADLVDFKVKNFNEIGLNLYKKIK
jgi:SAM-dependent methyltransferase